MSRQSIINQIRYVTLVAAVMGLGWLAISGTRTGDAVAAAPTTRGVSGTLLDADGRAAAGVVVVLVVEGCSEDIENGAIHLDADAQKTNTDAAGHFIFEPTTRPAGSVVAVTADGRAFAFVNDLRSDQPLRVKPFSYVEGTVRIRGHVGANEPVTTWCWPTDGGTPEGKLGSFTFSTTADAQGHFRMPVLGGETSMIGRVQPIHYGDNMPRRVELLVPPATTVQQDLGGDGRLVTFNVSQPPQFKFKSAQVYMTPDVTRIVAASPPWPADSIHWDKTRQEAFYDAWKASDSGKTALAEMNAKYRTRNSKYYYGHCDADGAVRLEDVLPGNYRQMVRARGADAAGKARVLESDQRVSITAPAADRPDEPMMLDDVTLGLLRRLYVGDVAPDFDFAKLDGGRVKLSDYHGKFVLVHFWATWCGPCRGATPYLKAIDERLGHDERFVSVHVAEDDTMPAAQRYVTAEQMKGVQAWSGPAEQSDVVRAYGAEEIPTMVLVGPDGKARFSTNSGEDLLAAVEHEMAQSR